MQLRRPRRARNVQFIQMIGVTSVGLMSCPTVSVPNMKANDAEPRIQPYSNSFPANRGLAALTDNASAREVVGAREAAWITVMKSSNAKECAQNKAAADAAAKQYKLREQSATNLLDLQTSQRLVRREDASTSRQRAQSRSPVGLGLSFRKIVARMATLRRKRRTKRHKEGYRRPVH